MIDGPKANPGLSRKQQPNRLPVRRIGSLVVIPKERRTIALVDSEEFLTITPTDVQHPRASHLIQGGLYRLTEIVGIPGDFRWMAFRMRQQPRHDLCPRVATKQSSHLEDQIGDRPRVGGLTHFAQLEFWSVKPANLKILVAALQGFHGEGDFRKEIDEIATGEADAKSNVLVNAPHTIKQITADTWEFPYSREKAAFPLPYVADNKFWPAVRRVDDAYGDRNLICTCAPIEAYEEVE